VLLNAAVTFPAPPGRAQRLAQAALTARKHAPSTPSRQEDVEGVPSGLRARAEAIHSVSRPRARALDARSRKLQNLGAGDEALRVVNERRPRGRGDVRARVQLLIGLAGELMASTA